MRMTHLLLTLAVIYMFYKNLSTPTNLGLHNGSLAPCPYTPNCYSSKQRNVPPIIFSGKDPISQVARALENIQETKILTKTDTYLHAICISKVFRFRDDVEFYYDDGVIHFRSASRVGYSDLGVNRKRIENVRKQLS